MRRLASEHPEVVPALPLLPELAAASASVAAAVTHHNPAVGERLAFAEALDVVNRRSGGGRRTVPIVALVAGEAGEYVRLVRLGERLLGWREKGEEKHGGPPLPPRSELSMPFVSPKEDGWWSAEAGPVQQICSAPAGRGSWLAIRQLAVTTIIQPLYHRVPLASSSPPSLRLTSRVAAHAASHVEAGEVVSLPIRLTGGARHADVGFNPWYRGQLAILDQAGHWGVWNITRSKRTVQRFKAELEVCGSLELKGKRRDDDGEDDDNEKKGGGDGWGRICWVGDPRTLAVFTRRHVEILNLRTRPAGTIPFPELGLSSTSTCIVDAQRSPLSNGHIFVATTSHIFWIAVENPVGSVSTEAEAPHPTCKVLLSWRHSQGEGDKSLRLSVTECQGSQYCVSTSFSKAWHDFFADSVRPSQVRCCCSIRGSVA